MKYRDSEGNLQEIYLPPTGDTLPIGSVIEYAGDTVPTNWELIEDINIVTNGEPVKTGRKIDGKDEYVKRYAHPFSSNTATFSHGLTNVIITGIDGYYANADFSALFPLPSIRTGFTDYTTEFYISGGNVNINVAFVGRDGFTAYVNIYFTYNEEVTTNEN